MRFQRAAWLAAVLLLALSATAQASQPPAPAADVVLAAGQTVGQTFVARRAGLDGIEILLSPEDAGDGQLLLRLRADPESREDLRVAELPLAQVVEPAFYRFTFDPLPESQGRYYYAFLEMAGAGAVTVGADSGDAYLDGAQYVDGQPVDAQTRFRLQYSSRYLILDLGRILLTWIGMAAITVLLFIVPGWALLEWLHPAGGWAWPERMGVAVGLSLALYPLLMLWTHIVHLQLGLLYAWLPLASGLVVIVWRGRAAPRRAGAALGGWWASGNRWPDLSLVVVIGLAFGARFWVIRLLDAPLWGDSVQHAALVQLMLDNGGLFRSWQPYAPYASLTIHYGFSAIVAAYSWLAGADSVQATLLVGQIANGLAALAIYPLAARFAGGNRWAGVGAVLVAGLLSPMPAYYVNWGRYAQLAGQAVLPAALWLLWEVIDADRLEWRKVGLAGGALAGMLLTYYRIPFYYATFVVAWLIGAYLPRWRLAAGPWGRAALRLALIGGVAFLLFLPWGVRVSSEHLAGAVEASLLRDSPLAVVLSDYAVWRDIAAFVPRYLLIATLTGLGLSVIQGRWAVASVGLWVVGLALVVAARLIHLPGAFLMQNYAIVIALYLPVSLVVGWLIGQGATAAGRHGRLAGPLGIGVVAAGLAGWSAWQQVKSVRADQQSFVMVTRPDSRAMTWISRHTPVESRFLVEGFRIYNGTSAVGSDAGWWIPLLAGRENSMPPQYAMNNEAPSPPDYTQRVVDLVAGLETAPLASPSGLRLLCDWGITHVYIGQGQGLVSREKLQLYSPGDLAASAAYRLVYHQDRVYVFALNDRACEAGV